ncbi:MAG: DNA mismatch repair endonuclease MutL [Parasporobacterium sp.]|nr:DNA mismatch repair endonuclease MutL [Parasporobacterium sp.]
MNEIKLLDQNTIDKIAAGEVVDRPASIVKELVENSIDAGADAISIEIRNGGLELIRITDNGSGIRRDQISLAFLRHSTSKITDASDISFIHTLGFRGEALSSIAAVSKTQLCTKTENDLTGVIYRINGGKEQSLEDAALPNGTTVIVRDLFYNTPARLKFLKSPQTEAGYITDIVQRIAMSRPDISFKFTSNGSVRLSTSGNGSLKDAIYAIFGRDITANLLDVDDRDDNLSVTGFIGKPQIARGNRSFEFFFVNGRYVGDRIIQKALEEAYAGYQMKGTFPFAVLNIVIEPELIDVNVHPSKMEIRFFDSESVFRSIYDIIRKRIIRRESIPDISIGKQETREGSAEELSENRPKEKVYIPEPFEIIKRKEMSDYPVFREETEYAPERERILPDNVPSQESMKQQTWEEIPFVSEAAKPSHRIVGEVFDTYWIVEYNEQMYIIDQHAAHEKVLYERIVKRLQEERHYSQKLFPSVILTLSSREEETLKRYAEEFRHIGFEAEHFGGSEYALSAVPADLFSLDQKLWFTQMLDDLSDVSSGAAPQILTDRIATAACKAAVKGGNILSVQQAQALIDELMTLDNPYNCPHGRPTIVSMSKYELEKKFKRIL